jgi:tRNA A-37 threonylcarbamoyl transferase component Bud32/tetratricopeptide (TPR) repeat protein
VGAYDESRARGFIEALAGAGGRAAAVRFHERFSEKLAEELELRPDAETRALVERIRESLEVWVSGAEERATPEEDRESEASAAPVLDHESRAEPGGPPIPAEGGGPGPPADDTRLEGLRAALADRYQVEREIGRGGMATVYLARDLKHDRQVAVKVFDPELAQALWAERFLREIKTAANLTHPHILPVFDSGQAGGFLFYAMPYVEGESLRTRLTKEKQLSVEDALRITREVADALAYAHEKGVIHRDVKPANILLEAGHAVLADFGVAQAVAEAGAGTGEDRITRAGTSLGTPAYMSPEQASGERELDGRSDQYALGCVLYVMLAGQPPFTGPTAESVLKQHLNVDPPPVTGGRPTIPAEVVHTLSRSLAKAPADRFRDAAEMAAALWPPQDHPTVTRRPSARIKAVAYSAALVLGLAAVAVFASRWTEGGTEPSRHVVAVMPLENHTGDPSLDGYADLAADYLTRGLMEASGQMEARTLQVLDYTDVLSISDEVAREGGPSPGLSQSWPERTVATLAVKGGYYPVGDSIEFRLNVVDTENTLRGMVTPIRAGRGDPSEGLGRLQVQVAGRVAGIVMPGHELDHTAAAHYPPKLEAHREFMEAWRTFESTEWEASIPGVERALSLDSTYFRPLHLLRAAYFNLGRAAEMDSVCQVMEERIHLADRYDRLSAERDCPNVRSGDRSRFEISREVADLSPVGSYLHALLLINVNRPREAVEHFARYDPALGPMYRAWEFANAFLWAKALHMLGEHSRELEVVRDVRPRFPDEFRLINQEIRALIALELYDDALRMIEDQLDLGTPGQDPANLLSEAGLEFDAHGAPTVAVELLERALRWLEARTSEDLETARNRRQRVWHLLCLDRLEEAENLLEPLVSELPDTLSHQGYLGILKARLGEREVAEGISGALESWDQPVSFALNTVFRARIAAYLGEPEDAVRLLEQAMEEGWLVRGNPHRDPFLKPLRGHPAFERFLKPKG